MTAPPSRGRGHARPAGTAAAQAVHLQEQRDRRVIHLMFGSLVASSLAIFGLAVLIASTLADRPARHVDSRGPHALDLRGSQTPDLVAPAPALGSPSVYRVSRDGVADLTGRGPVDLTPAWTRSAELGERWQTH